MISRIHTRKERHTRTNPKLQNLAGTTQRNDCLQEFVVWTGRTTLSQLSKEALEPPQSSRTVFPGLPGNRTWPASTIFSFIKHWCYRTGSRCCCYRRFCPYRTKFITFQPLCVLVLTAAFDITQGSYVWLPATYKPCVFCLYVSMCHSTQPSIFYVHVHVSLCVNSGYDAVYILIQFAIPARPLTKLHVRENTSHVLSKKYSYNKLLSC